MTLHISDAPVRRTMSVWVAAVTAVVIAAVVLAMTPTRANAIATPVPLGTAGSFAVLAGSAVTNTGPSQITGDLGVSPGTAISGFPPGVVFGAQHSADAVALQAKQDLVTAYNNAAGQPADVTYPAAPDPVELGGRTLDPGVYRAPISAAITGTLTLDAHGDPNAVWVFQIGSTLTTASASAVSLINGASPCNVYWQIGSSATLGTNSSFVGTIMALTSISATTGATIQGRALARNGAVTLDTNTINRGTCASATTGGTTGGLITGGVIAGATTGGTTAGTTGSTTVGAIGGVPTGGGTSGVLGGLLGGVLTTGGTLSLIHIS
ncbi:ice-binding family protein, partial [Streptomyces resistomycificus]|uniref:ice-binding family protein n=1 Tax=Streptomyces resistomycificus TaxID=67356 RepID=UPI0007C5A4C1